MLYHLLVGCGAVALLAVAGYLIQRWTGCERRIGGCCGGKDCDDQP